MSICSGKYVFKPAMQESGRKDSVFFSPDGIMLQCAG
jgi:hypothetical protein